MLLCRVFTLSPSYVSKRPMISSVLANHSHHLIVNILEPSCQKFTIFSVHRSNFKLKSTLIFLFQQFNFFTSKQPHSILHFCIIHYLLWENQQHSFWEKTKNKTSLYLTVKQKKFRQNKAKHRNKLQKYSQTKHKNKMGILKEEKKSAGMKRTRKTGSIGEHKNNNMFTKNNFRNLEQTNEQV